eukprot:TRINITY_DN73924_c0_g1_i1.p1 TRINITY_DN73924_c0_g1~~TRINITY_DN73924_c0_g1_i1.p1  ORF type:complete len:875 (-),score=197.37 TRINITY_DN73924_c0_g1_i1:510-3083(-)
MAEDVLRDLGFDSDDDDSDSDVDVDALLSASNDVTSSQAITTASVSSSCAPAHPSHGNTAAVDAVVPVATADVVAPLVLPAAPPHLLATAGVPTSVDVAAADILGDLAGDVSADESDGDGNTEAEDEKGDADDVGDFLGLVNDNPVAVTAAAIESHEANTQSDSDESDDDDIGDLLAFADNSLATAAATASLQTNASPTQPPAPPSSAPPLLANNEGSETREHVPRTIPFEASEREVQRLSPTVSVDGTPGALGSAAMITHAEETASSSDDDLEEEDNSDVDINALLADSDRGGSLAEATLSTGTKAAADAILEQRSDSTPPSGVLRRVSSAFFSKSPPAPSPSDEIAAAAEMAVAAPRVATPSKALSGVHQPQREADLAKDLQARLRSEYALRDKNTLRATQEQEAEQRGRSEVLDLKKALEQYEVGAASIEADRDAARLAEAQAARLTEYDLPAAKSELAALIANVPCPNVTHVAVQTGIADEKATCLSAPGETVSACVADVLENAAALESKWASQLSHNEVVQVLLAVVKHRRAACQRSAASVSAAKTEASRSDRGGDVVVAMLMEREAAAARKAAEVMCIQGQYEELRTQCRLKSDRATYSSMLRVLQRRVQLQRDVLEQVSDEGLLAAAAATTEEGDERLGCSANIGSSSFFSRGGFADRHVSTRRRDGTLLGGVPNSLRQLLEKAEQKRSGADRNKILSELVDALFKEVYSLKVAARRDLVAHRVQMVRDVRGLREQVLAAIASRAEAEERVRSHEATRVDAATKHRQRLAKASLEMRRKTLLSTQPQQPPLTDAQRIKRSILDAEHQGRLQGSFSAGSLAGPLRRSGPLSERPTVPSMSWISTQAARTHM